METTTAQDIINQAEQEEGRRKELLEIFYPVQYEQEKADTNITVITKQMKGGINKNGK